MHLPSPRSSLHLAASLILLFSTAPVAAKAHKSCQAWAPIVADLKASFRGCSAEARMAMRAAFHDCFPGSACDGSLILANECNDRPDDNGQIVPLCDALAEKAVRFNVTGSVADLIQVAGAVAITSCAGPRTTVYVGRRDSSHPSPEGQLLTGEATAEEQLAACKARGFSAVELVALVGAHSAGTTQQGLAFDSTPEKLDSSVFYPETAAQRSPTSLQSDFALSNHTQTRASWRMMGVGGQVWRAHFVAAMRKMSTLGCDVKTLADCSYLI